MALHRRTFCMAAIAAAAGSILPWSACAVSAGAFPVEAANRRFSVLHKGELIGRHFVWSVPAGDGLRVTTEVELTVKRWFLTLFSFRHRSEEVWHDGRLQILHSETIEDGVTFRVDGAAMPSGFRVVGHAEPFIVAATTLTSNGLWNHAILREETIIDAHYGGVVGLSVRRLADDVLEIAGRSVAATRFRLITPNVAGTVWYDGRRHWVSGELERSGATLQYRLEP